METRFLQTTLAIDFIEQRSFGDKLIEKAFFFIPEANPGYKGRMHLVKIWLVEFNSEGYPSREVGLSQNGNVVLAGPSERDYGFWLDSNMKYGDFTGTAISEAEFENAWKESEAFRETGAA